MSSLADLRKELKEARKSAMPVPVSRMKKADCASELARLKSVHRGEEKKVEEVLKSADVPKKVAKVVKAVQEKAHAKGEETVKRTKGPESKKEESKKEESKKSVAKVSVPTTDKPAKGSEEMKERMRLLREKRADKKKE